MRRSKKSLGSAILVSVLSASMTFSMPAYALTIDSNKTVNENVTDGLRVNSEVNATINGNVSDKTEGGGKIVEINHGSKVTINGDVNTNIENSQGDLTVSGNVDAKVDDSYYNGVKTDNGSTTIGKDVKVETKTEGNAVYVHATPQDDTTGNANVSVGGDISINSSGNTYVFVEDPSDDEENNEDNDATKEIYFRDPAGLRVVGLENATATAKVSGKIEASSKGVATGIGVSTIGFPKRPGLEADSSGTVKIDISSGSVSASGDKEIDKSQVGELINSESKGIYIKNGRFVNSEVNITVDGDLTSEIGIDIDNINDKTAKAVNNIIVDGTIKAADDGCAVRIYNRNENDNTFSLTTWKIDSDKTDNNVVVKKAVADDDETIKRVVDKEASAKLSDDINYIIRHEGTITLDGVTTVHDNNGKSYDTAKANKQLTIHVKVDDDKKYRVDRVEGGTATATRNADGSWTLTVPKNGGVDIRAVLVAIEQSNHSSGSSSSGGSGSSRPGVNNASTGMTTTTPEGATVQTNVTKSDTSTTTAATVRIGTATANVTSSVSEQNGTKVTFQNASGNLAGASFKTVGQVSADGTTLVKEDGTTAKMATGMLLAIENADGTSVGCFVDATGKTIATGAFEVYYMLGTDGKLHAHFVNPQGYFMTGIQVINGQTVTFNAVGEMVSVL